jgi:hypothetical protein
MSRTLYHCRGPLTISDNVLTVGESAGGEEQAGLPHPHPGGFLEGAGGGGGGGVKHCTAAGIAKAL